MGKSGKQSSRTGRWKRRLAIGGVVIAVLAALGIAAAGDFLFEFALNPHAPFTMHDMMSAGQVKGASDKAEVKDAAYEAEAKAWFSGARKSVSMTSDDGIDLKGWEVDQPSAMGALAESGAVEATDGSAESSENSMQVEPSHLYGIFCHGYMDSPEGMAKYAYHFYQQGYSVLLPEARAHGRSGGAFIGMGWPERRDVVKWARQIVARDPRAQIILYGVSMGAATVMMASGEADLPQNVRLIIEDCGYSSVWDEFSLQLKNVFGLPSFPLLNAADAWCQLRAGYSFEGASAVDQLKRARVPMLFIHGTADSFVPYSMLDTVYDACASPVKRKVSVTGAPHAQSASVDPELYWSSVDGFVADNLA